jgi:hypothetical protein
LAECRIAETGLFLSLQCGFAILALSQRIFAAETVADNQAT